MGRIILIVTVVAFVMALGVTYASASGPVGHNNQFSWFRDADGDGIPNGLDDDWMRPEDGSGYKVKNAFGMFFSGLFSGHADFQNANRNQYRNRADASTPNHDNTRSQLRLRDGSCE